MLRVGCQLPGERLGAGVLWGGREVCINPDFSQRRGTPSLSVIRAGTFFRRSPQDASREEARGVRASVRRRAAQGRHPSPHILASPRVTAGFALFQG